MEFRVALSPRALPQKISLKYPLFLAGSCFTEHMSARLAQHKFSVFENPHGILFNPASICRSLGDVLDGRVYGKEDLFEDGQGLWSSWDFHGRFSSPDPALALDAMNQSVAQAAVALRSAQWVILTLGSAYVYELAGNRVVANCHRAPADVFRRRLMLPDEVLAGIDPLLHRLRIHRPGIRFLFTVSPVRHLREGFAPCINSWTNLKMSIIFRHMNWSLTTCVIIVSMPKTWPIPITRPRGMSGKSL
jgi:hypothetical protein